MLWQGNYYKAGLREEYHRRLPQQQASQAAVVEVVVAVVGDVVVVVVVVVVDVEVVEQEEGKYNINTTSSFSPSPSSCSGANREQHTFSSLRCKQRNDRRAIYTREGSTSPTLMGFKPIQSGDSYDVIRGGHRQFWLVRR